MTVLRLLNRPFQLPIGIVLVAMLSGSAVGFAAERKKHHKHHHSPSPSPSPSPLAPLAPLHAPSGVGPTDPLTMGRMPVIGSGLTLNGLANPPSQTGLMQGPQLGTISVSSLTGVLPLAPSWVTVSGGMPVPWPGAVLLQAQVAGTQLQVKVPAGIRRVVVQRTAGTGWKSIANAISAGIEPTTIQLPLPAAAAAAELRVLGYQTNRFTSAQLSGESDFVWREDYNVYAPPLGWSAIAASGANPIAAAPATPIPTLSPASIATALTGPPPAKTGTELVPYSAPAAAIPPGADVSDIWKIIGSRLFFFNQNRGLQIFDLTDPVHPRKTGQLSLTNKGEYFHALDDTGSHLALLTRTDAYSQNRGDFSAIQIITVSTAGVPTLTSSVLVSGYTGESIVSGNRLYLVESKWESPDTSDRWSHWGRIHGYDLTSPAAPRDLGTLDIGASSPVLQSQGGYLLAADDGSYWDYWNYWELRSSLVSVIDISGSGTPRLVKGVRAAGHIGDASKMNVVGDTLVTVSVRYGSLPSPDGTGGTVQAMQNWAETFALNDVSTVAVTQSEVQIPGSHDFLFPNGDRLFAVGRQDNQIACSYFDVSDPGSPKELARVLLGDDKVAAFFESDYDPRCITFLPGQGEAFVTFFTEDNGTSVHQSFVQTIHITHDSIAKGAVSSPTGTARRGSKVNGHLVSISNREMIIASDPATGDSVEEAWVELAWPVNQVLAVGDYLVEIDAGIGYFIDNPEEPIVRLTSRSDPDTVLDSVSLGQGHLSAVEQRGNTLYLAQEIRLLPPPFLTLVPDAPPAGSSQLTLLAEPLQPTPSAISSGAVSHVTLRPEPMPTHLRTWSVTISNNRIQQCGSTDSCLTTTPPAPGTGPSRDGVQACWVTDTQLVWHVPFERPGYLPYGFLITPVSSQGKDQDEPGVPCAIECPVVVASDGGVAASDSILVTMPGNGALVGVSKAIASNGFLLFSSKRTGSWVGSWLGGNDFTPSASTGAVVSGQCRLAYGEFACSLHVLDFTQSAVVLRDPAPLPGILLSTAATDEDGAWLITERLDGHTGTHWVQALAYDGVRAHRTDQFNTNEWEFAATASTEGRALCAVNHYQSYDGRTSYYASLVLLFRVSTRTGMLSVPAPWTLSQNGPAFTNFGIVGSQVLASTWGQLGIATLNGDDTFSPQVVTALPAEWLFDVSHAALDTSTGGAWIPLGAYGVGHALPPY